MTPIEFGVSRSKVKVTVTLKLRGHTCFTFLVYVVNIFNLNLDHFTLVIKSGFVFSVVLAFSDSKFIKRLSGFIPT